VVKHIVQHSAIKFCCILTASYISCIILYDTSEMLHLTVVLKLL